MQDVTKAKVSWARRWAGALVLGGTLAVLGAVFGLSTQATSRVPASRAQNDPLELHPEGNFIHPAAGFTMPERVGPFERVAVTQYDQEGRDLSAGYNAVIGKETPVPIVATVYVYPVRPGAELDGYFEKLLKDLGQRHGGAKPDFRKNIELADGRFAGRYAVFGYTEPWGGLSRGVPLRSYLVLYQWKTWWVKWRVTTPAPIDAERMKAIVDLTESLLPPESDPDEPVGPWASDGPPPTPGGAQRTGTLMRFVRNRDTHRP